MSAQSRAGMVPKDAPPRTAPQTPPGRAELAVVSADEQPAIVEGELVELIKQPLRHPPATRGQVSCRCGKRSIEAHGGLTCEQVLALAARIAADEAIPAWRRCVAPAAAVLVGLAVAALLVWAVAAGVAALVATVAAVLDWIATHWPLALVGLLFLGGGTAKCAGIHCEGCKG